MASNLDGSNYFKWTGIPPQTATPLPEYFLEQATEQAQAESLVIVMPIDAQRQPAHMAQKQVSAAGMLASTLHRLIEGTSSRPLRRIS